MTEAGCNRERKAKRARTLDPASSSAADQHDASSSQMAFSNAKRAKHAKQGTAHLPASAHAFVTACLIQQPCPLVFVCHPEKTILSKKILHKNHSFFSYPPLIQGSILDLKIYILGLLGFKLVLMVQGWHLSNSNQLLLVSLVSLEKTSL